MPSELEELVGFLHSDRPDIVQIALQNLLGFCGPKHKQVWSYNNYTAIGDLKKLAQSKGRTTINQACTIMANLCDDVTIRNMILEDEPFVKHLAENIIQIENANADIMCILLTNLAKHDSINKILDYTVEHSEEQAKIFKSNKVIDCLMDCFVKGAERELNKFAQYDYLAYFFADISRFQQGRSYFITEQDYDHVVPLSKLLVFTEYFESKVRREGVASTIKNSLFDTNSHWKLVSDPEINILPYILLPIAGPEEIDEDDMFNLPDELQLLDPEKKRESVNAIIVTHLESILLLCTTKKLRQYLREKSVYAIIKQLYSNVNDDDVGDACDRVVQLLMRDEAPEDEDQEDESDEEDDQVVEIL